MAGASFILAINLFIAALFALAFFLVGVSNRADKVAPFFALAYVFGILYIASEFVLPLEDYPQFAYTAGFASFLGAVTSVSLGVARRYGRRAPWAWVIGAKTTNRETVAATRIWMSFLVARGAPPPRAARCARPASGRLLLTRTGWLAA